ncbi:MAG: ATP-binding protein [Opitutaceae bacterium]|nr:ATP-binding protein [Opitutaceae bacterium]
MDKILAKALGQDVAQLAAEEKQRLLSRLLARLAHEIRNPLSSLDIHVQLLEEDLGELAPPVREKLSARIEVIHGELHRLENIVRQFLSLAGPSSVNLQPVEMGRVAGHVCELLRPEAAARGIEISLHVPATLPPLTADPVQVTQALVNLVINAIQAIENTGRIEVRVTADHKQNRLMVDVHDSGPGVPAGKQATIFEPFFTTRTEGGGLGLWIVQQIATAHGGSVGVANAPTGGAVFTLQLPLQPTPNFHA